MSDNESRDRHQQAVYWQITSYNDLGEVVLADPIPVYVRVEEFLEETLDPQGNLISAPVEMNVDREIPVGSIFWIGDPKELDTETLPELYQVIEYEETPDVFNRKFDRNVLLMNFRDKTDINTSVIFSCLR